MVVDDGGDKFYSKWRAWREANPFEARDTFVAPHRFCVSEWDRRAATLLATTFWRYLWWVADTTAL